MTDATAGAPGEERTDLTSGGFATGGERTAVSVVVPARNEEEHIGACVEAVDDALSPRYDVEIVVVDDGSTDATPELARRAGATVMAAPVHVDTIGGLRNTGVRATDGEVLVFLDADVVVQEGWGERFDEIVGGLLPPARVLTGSVCDVPEDAGWIEEAWFGDRLDRPTHLGSGHLLMSRALFYEIGGFDASLATGEDYDLCRRAVALGAEIRLDPRLPAVHHGFPETLSQFARREVWHGAGDAASLSRYLRSKVALAATAFAGFHAAALLGIGRLAVVGWAATAGILAVVVGSAVVKFGLRPEVRWLRVLPLTYVYLAARFASLFVGATRRDGAPPGA